MAGFSHCRLGCKGRRFTPLGDTAAECLRAPPKCIECPRSVVQYKLDTFSRCQGPQRVVAEDIRLGDADQASLRVQALNEGLINAMGGLIIQG